VVWEDGRGDPASYPIILLPATSRDSRISSTHDWTEPTRQWRLDGTCSCDPGPRSRNPAKHRECSRGCLSQILACPPGASSLQARDPPTSVARARRGRLDRRDRSGILREVVAQNGQPRWGSPTGADFSTQYSAKGPVSRILFRTPKGPSCGHSSRRRVAADTHQRPTRRFRPLHGADLRRGIAARKLPRAAFSHRADALHEPGS
jgi:hypothetical protein